MKPSHAAGTGGHSGWLRLADAYPEPIVVVSGEAITYVNTPAVDLFGAITPTEIVGLSLPDLCESKYSRTIAERLEILKAGEPVAPLEYGIVRLDGRKRRVEDFPLPSVNGEDAVAHLVIRDITDRITAEHALRRYAERLAALREVESLVMGSEPAAVVANTALDRLGSLLNFAHAYVVEVNEVTGEGICLAVCGDLGSVYVGLRESNHFFDSVDEPPVCASDRPAIADGPAYDYTTIELGVGGDLLGRLVIASTQGEAFPTDDLDAASEMAHLIALCINQERLEADRRAYEIELLGAKDKAEDMVRLKTTFLTNMSHEIRTPITGIMGFAQILSEEVDDQSREFANLIVESGRRLLATINSVLDLARLESEKMPLDPKGLDASRIVSRVAADMEPVARRKGLRLSVLKRTPTAWARLDPGGFERILQSLLGNAIKFTNVGGVTVEIGEKGGEVVLKVRDTGIGISKSFQPHLFEEFRQENPDSDRMHEGSGMGLAITRKLVDLMSGSIAVESEPMVGSTFTVSFPRILKDRGTGIASDRESVGRAKRNRLLVVQDGDDARFLLRYLLSPHYKIQFASGVDEALLVLRNGGFDAVVLEINLGGAEAGLRLVRDLRAVHGGLSIPVIGISTLHQPETSERLYAEGLTSVVSDPFAKDSLLPKIAAAVSQRRTSSAVK